jgi:hypothetical protein
MQNKIIKANLELNQKYLFLELPSLSNVSFLDLIKTNNGNILSIEDFIAHEEKISFKCMLFYPEKIIWKLISLIFFESKKKSKKINIKKIIEYNFSFISKYYISCFIWENSKTFLSIFFDRYLKYILCFFCLFLFKFTKNFLANFKCFLILRSLNFFLIIFYFFKDNFNSSQISFYDIKNYKIKIQNTIVLFINFNLQKRNYYKVIIYSKLFLFIYYNFYNFNQKIKTKIFFNQAYILENIVLDRLFNFEISLYKNKNYLKIQRILIYEFKKFIYKHFEIIANYLELYLLKLRQKIIKTYLNIIENKITKYQYLNSKMVAYILTKNKNTSIKIYKYYNQEAIEKNLIYTSMYLKLNNNF